MTQQPPISLLGLAFIAYDEYAHQHAETKNTPVRKHNCTERDTNTNTNTYTYTYTNTNINTKHKHKHKTQKQAQAQTQT
jgi:hypothetical protein